MAIDSKDGAVPQYLTGRFTSTAGPAAHTETLPWAPSLFILYTANGAANPDMYTATAANIVSTMRTLGSSGVISLVTVANGITINTTTSAVLIAAAAQVASGVNNWIAFK